MKTRYFKKPCKFSDKIIDLEVVAESEITCSSVAPSEQISSVYSMKSDKAFSADCIKRRALDPTYTEITENEYNNILNFKTQQQCQTLS